MCDEIDFDLFTRTAKFCVYLHKRPDGSIFYVGKGLRSRAYDFAPSRRTVWHRNIVAKHGRENITVTVIPCASEVEALALERVHIAAARRSGEELANLTDGGEGVSGREMSEKQRQALEKGRMKGKRGSHSPKPGVRRWLQTEEGQQLLKRRLAAAIAAPRKSRQAVCAECGCEFTTKSPKAKCCSRKCEQRFRRAGKNVEAATC